MKLTPSAGYTTTLGMVRNLEDVPLEVLTLLSAIINQKLTSTPKTFHYLILSRRPSLIWLLAFKFFTIALWLSHKLNCKMTSSYPISGHCFWTAFVIPFWMLLLHRNHWKCSLYIISIRKKNNTKRQYRVLCQDLKKYLHK